MSKNFNSLYEMMEAIPDEKAAVEYFRSIHWKNGEHCPYCGHEEIYHFADGKNFKCAACRQRFSIRVGTIFEDSKIEIRKWLFAIWIITSHKKGIASTQLAKDINVTQKSAWFMLHRLRHAARTRSFNRKLRGTVEADEVYFGGKDSNKHKRRRTKKQVAVGLLERRGELRVLPVNSTSDMRKEIVRHVDESARLMTDNAPVLSGIEALYDRTILDHSKGQYGDGADGHTNSIEGAWALLKRQIYGIHHWVSAKHLSRYIDEAVFRYNRREVTDTSRVEEFLGRLNGHLTYRQLIA